MAKKTTKPAKPKPAAKKPAPAKAKKPAPKNKQAVKKVSKPVAKKPTKPVTKTAAPKKPAPKKSAAKQPVKVANKPVAKGAAAKKPVKPVAKKPAPKKPAVAKKVVKTPAKKIVKPAVKKPASKASTPPRKTGTQKHAPQPPVKVNGWLAKQRTRLLNLKDELLDAMNGVGRDTLRTRAEGSDASAFGMHTGDAGSDAYDRDFALSLLSQERDSLFEIDAALKKIDDGTYGVCEISGKPIPHIRLEARPFARYTVECQAELEKNNRFTRARQPVTSLFGLGEEDSDSEDEDTQTDTKE